VFRRGMFRWSFNAEKCKSFTVEPFLLNMILNSSLFIMRYNAFLCKHTLKNYFVIGERNGLGKIFEYFTLFVTFELALSLLTETLRARGPKSLSS